MGRDRNDLTFIGASVCGPAHVEAGLVCQDAFAFASTNLGAVLALSDGLGSATRSQEGAEAAVHAAVDAVGGRSDSSCSAAFDAIRAARLALGELARGSDLDEFACTLLVGVAGRDELVVAQIGDGGVVAETAGDLVLVSDPGDSEYVDEVEPLTAADWENRIRYSGAREVTAISMFSDGCQRAALTRSAGMWIPHPGFFNPLFRHARSALSAEEGSKDIETLLAGRKMTECSEDDKTLLIALLS